MIRAELAPSEPPRAPAWARPAALSANIPRPRPSFSPARRCPPSIPSSDPTLLMPAPCAAAVVQNLLNRREDESALRDAVALARPGQALGPAGRVYAAFRTLCGPGDPFRPERLAGVAADLMPPLDLDR